MEDIQTVARLLAEVKAKNPLVHHLTNYVTVNDCANIVLALGGSPVMADDAAEVEEMVAIASALVINIGTLNARTIQSMFLAGKKANQLGIPVTLDPVGVGATALRTNTANELLQEIKFAVIRGNQSEIKILAGLNSKTRGVDAVVDFTDHDTSQTIAMDFALKTGSTIAMTGAQDIISDGKRTGLINNGHPILSKITGTGCMATSLVGCYSGVTNDYFLAASAGIITMGLAGEKALASLSPGAGIGSFKANLFDWVYKLRTEDLLQGAKFEVK